MPLLQFSLVTDSFVLCIFVSYPKNVLLKINKIGTKNKSKARYATPWLTSYSIYFIYIIFLYHSS